jgi:hypothetical protein
VAIWTQEVAKRLAAKHEVVVWSRSLDPERALLRVDGVDYRFVRGRGDYRLERTLRPTIGAAGSARSGETKRRSRQPRRAVRAACLG